jgi:hypothetical protein
MQYGGHSREEQRGNGPDHPGESPVVCIKAPPLSSHSSWDHPLFLRNVKILSAKIILNSPIIFGDIARKS